LGYIRLAWLIGRRRRGGEAVWMAGFGGDGFGGELKSALFLVIFQPFTRPELISRIADGRGEEGSVKGSGEDSTSNALMTFLGRLVVILGGRTVAGQLRLLEVGEVHGWNMLELMEGAHGRTLVVIISDLDLLF